MASFFFAHFVSVLAMTMIICQRLALVLAADQDPLQDFCVADFAQPLHVTGYACKNPAQINASDFVYHGLSQRANTSNDCNATATLAFVEHFAGLNSLGLSMARLDLDLGGIIPPHTHPRGSEIIFVIEGSLYAGFVDTNNKLYAQVINAGDVMLFPRGLIHFQLNVGKVPAFAVVALNGQEPGLQYIANSMFGSYIKPEVLEKTFFLPGSEVENMQSFFSKP